MITDHMGLGIVVNYATQMSKHIQRSNDYNSIAFHNFSGS